MDILSNRLILIGAGILMSIMIITGVLISVDQIKKIYGYVGNTDISVSKEFDDISSTYNGADMNGVDLLNTLKRFEGNNLVTVVFPGSGTISLSPGVTMAKYIKGKMATGTDLSYTYEKQYRVSIEYIDGKSRVIITFKE